MLRDFIRYVITGVAMLVFFSVVYGLLLVFLGRPLW